MEDEVDVPFGIDLHCDEDMEMHGDDQEEEDEEEAAEEWSRRSRMRSRLRMMAKNDGQLARE